MKFVWTDPSTGESLTQEQFNDRFWKQRVFLSKWGLVNPTAIKNRRLRIFNQLPREVQKKTLQAAFLNFTKQRLAMQRQKETHV
jgi:hypothetical protein